MNDPHKTEICERCGSRNQAPGECYLCGTLGCSRCLVLDSGDCEAGTGYQDERWTCGCESGESQVRPVAIDGYDEWMERAG